jgi:putative transcriptional regulator
MSSAPKMPATKTIDDLLFEALSPSALERGERDVVTDDAAARALAEGRVATVALARALAPIPSAAPVVTGEAGGESGATLRARLVASLGRPGKYGIFVDRLARLFDVSIDKAREIVARVEDPSQLKPGPAEGIMWFGVKPGPKYGDALAMVGRLKPGTRFPHHAHVGEETTLVLDGGFRDASGEEVWRGDEMIMPAGSDHDFVVLDGIDCIAAVLARGGVSFD